MEEKDFIIPELSKTMLEKLAKQTGISYAILADDYRRLFTFMKLTGEFLTESSLHTFAIAKMWVRYEKQMKGSNKVFLGNKPCFHISEDGTINWKESGFPVCPECRGFLHENISPST